MIKRLCSKEIDKELNNTSLIILVMTISIFSFQSEQDCVAGSTLGNLPYDAKNVLAKPDVLYTPMVKEVSIEEKVNGTTLQPAQYRL